MSGSFVKDNAMAIHIGVELLVVGCLVYWVNKKTSTLEGQVAELIERNKHLEETLAKQSEVIAKHQETLQDLVAVINGHPPRPPTHSQTTQRSPPERPKNANSTVRVNPANTPRNRPPQPKPQETRNIPKTFEKAQRVTPQPRVEDVPSEEDETFASHLDEMMAEEIAELECNLETGECDKKKSTR